MKIFAGCVLILLGTLGSAKATLAAEETAAASAVPATSAPEKPATATPKPTSAPAASVSKAASAPAAAATETAPAPAASAPETEPTTTEKVTHAPAKVPKMLKLEAGKPRPKNLDLRHCLNLKDNKAIAKCAGE